MQYIYMLYICYIYMFFLSSNDGNNHGDFDGWAETSVRVRKGGFMVRTL